MCLSDTTRMLGFDIKTSKGQTRKRELQLRAVSLNSWTSDEDLNKAAFGQDTREVNSLFPAKSWTNRESPRISKLPTRRFREKTPVWFNQLAEGNYFHRGLHKYGNVSEKGIYNKNVDKLYKLLTRENSVMLPPLETSGRAKAYVPNHVNMAEKKYVMKDLQTEGKMSKFARDEVYLPSLNKNLFTCYECRRRYISDMYTEAFSSRNAKEPPCANNVGLSVSPRAHYCDVLGKRYCSHCGDVENRRVRKTIMDSFREEEDDTPDLSNRNSRLSFQRKRVVIDPIPRMMNM